MYPRVASYMKKSIYTVTPDDTLEDARNIMLSKGISKLVVVDDDEKPVGLITLESMVRALAHKFLSRKISEVKVGDAMTPLPATLTPMRTVKAAASLMLRYGLPAMPVIDRESGRLEGLVTRSSLVKAFSDRFSGVYRVSSIMRESFVSVDRGHSIFYVAKVIDLDASGKALVFDGKRLVGVISKSDLILMLAKMGGGLRKVARASRASVYRAPTSLPGVYVAVIAEDVMSPNPITVRPDIDASEAAEIMVRERVGILPVTWEDKVVGVVTKLEFLEALASFRKT